MKRWAVRGIFTGIVLALVLAGCGGVPKPQLTETEFNTSVSDFANNTSSVATEAADDLAFAALMDLYGKRPDTEESSASLGVAVAKLAGLALQGSVSLEQVSGLVIDIVPEYQTLPRGEWEWTYDSQLGEWVWDDIDENADDLILRWPFKDSTGTEHQASLTVDWDYNGEETIQVVDSDGYTVEVPRHARATLTIDGNAYKVSYLDGQFSWYSGSCGAILEPSSVSLTGHIGYSDSLDLNLTLDIGSSSMATKGSIELSTGGDSAKVEWDLSASGTIPRDDNCFIEFENIVINSGHGLRHQQRRNAEP